MTTLTDVIAAQIRAEGPIDIATYMQICLLHPQFGYYTTRDPLGRKGDFTTAPEISQMFGELLGLCLAQVWCDQGKPGSFVLAEPGGGRGTLMADILRATRGIPGFHAAAELHMIEASPVLRRAQAAALADFKPTWHGDLSTLPDNRPLFLVANEFFDALPIRQFQRSREGWLERRVGLVAAKAARAELCFTTTETTPSPALAQRLADTAPGDIVEIAHPAENALLEIATRIARNGGFSLIVDYGNWLSKGDTFQALRDHAPICVFAAPGESDLTAHVDFEALSKVAHGAGAQVTAMVPQGQFLEHLGITARAQALALNLEGRALENHIAAHRRLTHPDEMGALFKALGVTQPGAPRPPGFAPMPDHRTASS